MHDLHEISVTIENCYRFITTVIVISKRVTTKFVISNYETVIKER